MHKKTFSLETGECLTGDPYQVRVFKVKVERGEVFIELPPEQELDESLATAHYCQGANCDAG